MEYEYWYYTSEQGQGMIIVSVNTWTENTKVSFVDDLTTILLNVIPFAYEQTDAPYIKMLDDDRRKGILRVSMGIRPLTIGHAEAIEQLRLKQFFGE